MLSRRKFLAGSAAVMAASSLANVAVGQSYGYVRMDQGVFGAVGDGIADDTDAFNQALASLKPTGGLLEIVPRPYKVTSIDATGLNSVIIQGLGGGLDSPQGPPSGQGVRIIQGGDTYPVLDLTASAVSVRDIQIGTSALPAGRAGIFSAQTSAFPSSPQAATLLEFRRVQISGSWQAASFYMAGVQDADVDQCRFWNALGGAPGGAYTTVLLARSNIWNVPSAYRSLRIAEFGCGNWTFKKTEMHDHSPGVQPPSGSAVLLCGAGNISFDQKCSFDSSSYYQAPIICLDSADGTQCFNISLDDFTIYSENTNYPPGYGVYVVPGSTLNGLYVSRKNSVVTRVSHTYGTINGHRGPDAPL
jgi:hypothetical protein